MHQEAQPHTVRILHLEDSVLDHDVVKRTLRKAHLLFEIERVETLPEFEQAVKSSHFDVVLADYRLPGFTALDAWDILQNLALQPPFILLSGAIGETAAVDAIKLGMSDYLLKDNLGKLAHIEAASLMPQHALGASQRIMMNPWPAILDQGLEPAIDWLTREFEKRTGVKTAFRASFVHAPIGKAVQLTAYRTAQEALTNISKHAQRQAGCIELSDAKGVLTLEITDNGPGIPPSERDKSQAFGLKGLQERARTVGGWLDVSSRLGQGTSFTPSVPLTTASSEDAQDALLHQSGPYQACLEIAAALESPDTRATRALCKLHQISLEDVNRALLRTLAELPIPP